MCLFSSLILIKSFLNLTVNHTFEFLSAAKGRRRGVRSRLLSYVFHMQFFYQFNGLCGYFVFWPQKENCPHSRGLTLTQSWPLTLKSALGTYINCLSPYRITANIDQPHSNKHQETPWAEKNWKNSIHLNLSTQFSYMMCCSKDFFRFYFCHAMLLILHIFGITCRSILSLCVCPDMLWDLQLCVPFALSFAIWGAELTGATHTLSNTLLKWKPQIANGLDVPAMRTV